MSMVGDLGNPSPEFFAWLDSVPSAQGNESSSHKLTERKPEHTGKAADDDAINPIIAVAAYEYFTSGDGS